MNDQEEARASRRSGRRYLRAVTRVALPLAGLGVIALLVQRAGWRDVGQSFERLGLPALIGLVLLGLSEALLDGEALRHAMLGRLRLGPVLSINSLGAIVNLIIPFEAGEVAKAAMLRQHSTDSRVLSGLVVWNYVWKVSKPVLTLLAFGVALMVGHAFPERLSLPLAGGVAFAFVPYLTLRTLIRLRPAERGMRLLARLPVIKARAAKWVEGAARLDTEVRHFWQTHPRAYLAVFGLQFLARFTNLITLALFAQRLHLPFGVGNVAYLFAAFSASDYITMLVPRTFGVAEGAGFLLFRLLGLDPAAGLVIAVTMRLRAITVQAPFALAAWLQRPKTPPAP
jgi:hypothetical protein